MKKPFLSAVLAGLTAVSVFAAASRQSPSGRASGTQPGVTVRLLTDVAGIDDKSFNAMAWQGILEFYGDTWENARWRGTAYDVVTARTPDMFIPNIRQATEEGYDLIVTTGFTFIDALTEVASHNLNQKYMLIDEVVNLPNVLSAVFAEHEGSYLVGAAAALKAKADGIANPRFGFIGGIPGATITKFEVGYVQGILSVISDAQIVDYYVNSWAEPGLAKTQAKNWYDSGVYAIYSVAGDSGGGTIAQAREYRLNGRNVWAIGVDRDQYEDGFYNAADSAVLTSMLKRVDTALIYGLNQVKNNTFKGESILLDLKIDGVNYSAANPALTADIKARLEQIKQRIVSGEIKIAATNGEAKTLPGFPQNLRAMDN